MRSHRRGCRREASKAALVLLLASAVLLAGCESREDDSAYDREVRALELRIEGVPSNAALAAEVGRRLSRVRQDPTSVIGEISQKFDALGLVPLRVPGLFYRSHAWTGADLAGVSALLRREVALVETGEVDTVERNAACVRRAVEEATRGGGRVVLFSASKGGADVEAAFAGDPSLASRVAAWIDLVGLLEGTPLTEPGVAEAERRALGLPEGTSESISRGVLFPQRASLPPEVIAVHLAGFPTVATVSAAARPGFKRLRAFGPNDGFLLLDGFLRAPGRVLVLPAVDHYLRTPELGPTMVAVLSIVLDEIGGTSGGGTTRP